MKDKIVKFIKKTIDKYEYKGVIIGISGGIDSAVVAALCVEALGKDKVFGIMLPERDSAGDTLNDSKLVCKHLGISYVKKSISPILRSMGVYSLEPPAFFVPKKIKENYVKNKWNSLAEEDTFLDDLQNKGNSEFLKGLAYYRAKHRVRMCCMYMEAEKRNYAVVGTTNKTEYATGFYVKWGDDAVDIEPIMHLYKTQVFQLARDLKIPEKIINKAPSPDLIPGVTDEFALGMSYKQIDRILRKIEYGQSLKDEDTQKVERVKKIIAVAKKRDIRMVNIGGGTNAF